MKSSLRLSNERWPAVDLSQMANEAQSVPVDSAFRQWAGVCRSTPVLYVAATVISAVFSILGSRVLGLVGLAGLVVWPALAVMHFELSGATWAQWSDPLPRVWATRFGRRSSPRVSDLE